MKEMRIVGISDTHCCVWIQTREYRGDWEQRTVGYAEFDLFMADYFPTEYKKFLKERKPEEFAAKFFYNYGETDEMRRKGEAHVFTRYGEEN